ncbi:hypothetical protein LAZ67_17000561 [Cordylochernes scorpioides]|uniref:Glucose-methanol-choline oxidoreductase N-terminal domain-containing protein n=1 Tax=Cordylochernes scorpioides TaxID=51811 RepID=A0ABY6LGH5_9ARAC|nr:hypothetical protein LAZ67_17000561 [Cordylochernes scorpioides]
MMTKLYNFTGEVNLERSLFPGFTPVLTTIKDGVRQDTYDAFIEPVEEKRNNLFVLTKTFVKKVAMVPQILFKNRTAIGVEYDLLPWRIPCRAFARREVVVSAGAIASPQLLLLSGVGPRDVLQPLGIPVVSDLPVGRHLQDHLATPGLNFYLHRRPSPAQAVPEELRRYGNIGQALIQFLLSRDACRLPPRLHGRGVIEVRLASGPAGPPMAAARLFAYFTNLDETAWRRTYVPYLGIDGFTISTSILRPFSEGRLTLASTDPYQDPLIDLNYLSDPRDLHILMAVEVQLWCGAGLRYALRLANSSMFHELGAKVWDIPFHGCGQHEMYSDPYLECLIRHYTLPYQHYVGTCKMGAGPEDPTAVVDPQLRLVQR